MSTQLGQRGTGRYGTIIYRSQNFTYIFYRPRANASDDEAADPVLIFHVRVVIHDDSAEIRKTVNFYDIRNITFVYFARVRSVGCKNLRFNLRNKNVSARDTAKSVH